MNQFLLSGVCTALVTPFLDGTVNYPMVQQLLRRQMDAGVKAVVVAGTTGEAPTLSDDEKLELFHVAKEFSGDRCCVIAGTGSNSTAHAIALSQAAQETGIDALLVVTPYYNKATAEGLFAHYLSIANSVEIPIILYNVPSRTGVDIPVSVYERLSAVPNIIGVKEASPDITKITKIRLACGEHFGIWTGNDDMTVPSMALGANGVISVVSNVLPEKAVAMTNACLSGDFAAAATLQLSLQPLIELLFSAVNPIPVKTAMRLIGYDCGGCRLPLTNLSKDLRDQMAAFLCK